MKKHFFKVFMLSLGLTGATSMFAASYMDTAAINLNLRNVTIEQAFKAVSYTHLLGFYLSFGDRFNPSALRAAWPDFLFLETDDKSIDIRGVYQNVAEALDIPEEKLRIQIAKNVSIFHLNG